MNVLKKLCLQFSFIGWMQVAIENALKIKFENYTVVEGLLNIVFLPSYFLRTIR